MSFSKRRTYPGRKFVQALQVGLVIAIGVVSLSILTQSHKPTAEAVVVEAAATNAPVVTISNRAETLYEQALETHDESRYADAIELYTEAIELDPSMANAWLGRAVAYAQMGGHERASRNDFWHYVQSMEIERIEQSITVNNTVRVDMSEGTVFAFTFQAQSGNVLDIAAKSAVNGQAGESGVVDPLIILLDAEGNPLKASDDILRADGSLISMNSQIEDYRVQQDSSYTLLITHAGGGSYGSADVRVSVR